MTHESKFILTWIALITSCSFTWHKPMRNGVSDVLPFSQEGTSEGLPANITSLKSSPFIPSLRLGDRSLLIVLQKFRGHTYHWTLPIFKNYPFRYPLSSLHIVLEGQGSFPIYLIHLLTSMFWAWRHYISTHSFSFKCDFALNAERIRPLLTVLFYSNIFPF